MCSPGFESHRRFRGLVVTLGLLFAAASGFANQTYAHGDNDRVVLHGLGDRCSETLVGADMDVEGCPPDADRDSVPDSVDQCPGTPYGVRVDTRGCALDLDGDGVPYYRDRCHELLPPGARVDAEGCLVQLTLENVHFDFDRVNLKPEARVILDRLTESLAGRPDVERVMVGGHADSVGPMTYNQKLSERRARSVVDYLQRGGVGQSIQAAGYGETQPVASNASGGGRAMNRRVEIELTKAPQAR